MGAQERGVTVYLVGAGPGDPGLLTVRGRELLGRADVIVYDYLANDALLVHARPDARLVNVGKRGYERHLTQDEVNRLLVEEAREAARAAHAHDEQTVVVRLKGGDPFVFGRGGEEGLALRAAGISYKVVPGVTSGISAPGYAGIPVTHRKVSSSVTLVTGHEDPTRTESGVDYPALARLVARGDTVCFYMGVHELEGICARLVDCGAPADTPVALVRWGTLPRQQTLVACLSDAPLRAREAGFAAPAIIVVGRVAGLRDRLSWFEDAPLFGRRIVVTRSRAQAGALSARLAELGANVVEFPTIAFSDPESFEPLDAAIRGVSGYDWAIFTSANGVERFFARLTAEHGKDARALAGVKVAAIGPATARALEARGIRADCVPASYRAEAVFEASRASEDGALAGKRVLLARAAQARATLPELLAAAGAEVDVVAAYRTVVPKGAAAAGLADELSAGRVDAITFTSSSTAKNLLALLGPRAKELLEKTALCSIGPVTSQTLGAAGLVPACEAKSYTIPGLVEAICTYAASTWNSTCPEDEGGARP